MSVCNNSIIEKLEEEIKTSSITFSYFKYNLSSIVNESRSLSIMGDGGETLSYYKLKGESSYEYLLFELFCFFDMSLRDIYELFIGISKKYNKNDLCFVEYSDFEKLKELRSWNERKHLFVRDSPEYLKKSQLREDALNNNINHMVKDYDSTLEIIDCLNDDMKFICNDEDISPEKRLEYIDKYSKVSFRLNEKRFGLLNKIRDDVSWI